MMYLHVHLIMFRAIGASHAVPFEFLAEDGVWRLLYIDPETCAPVILP